MTRGVYIFWKGPKLQIVTKSFSAGSSEIRDDWLVLPPHSWLARDCGGASTERGTEILLKRASFLRSGLRILLKAKTERKMCAWVTLILLNNKPKKKPTAFVGFTWLQTKNYIKGLPYYLSHFDNCACLPPHCSSASEEQDHSDSLSNEGQSGKFFSPEGWGSAAAIL